MSKSVDYSGAPLVKKLGLRSGNRAITLGTPDGYRQWLEPEPEGVEWFEEIDGRFDFIHLFTRSRSELERLLPRLDEALRPDGVIWISWPKKASKVPTEVDEGLVRATALGQGLVDVKICAVDQVWSGLKLVIRKEDRAARR